MERLTRVRVELTLCRRASSDSVVFDVGPGSTADGRGAQLVVTDVQVDAG